jgi:nucleotide-binding universal stress UspA family protein
MATERRLETTLKYWRVWQLEHNLFTGHAGARRTLVEKPVALKDILVPLDAREGSTLRLRLAMELANRHASRLTALFVDEWSFEQLESRATAELGLATARDVARLDRSVAADIERSATRLRTALVDFQQEHGLEFEWLRSEGSADAGVSHLVPYRDLCILGHDSLMTGTTLHRGFCEQLVFSTVTPILFVPMAPRITSLGRRVVVAWDSSRPAARAVNDALVLIEAADQTTLVNVDCGLHLNTAASLEMLRHRLGHRGVRVDVVQIRAAAKSIAAALQAKAHELGADLLVAGAFGHSRLKERIFGGVSRDLLQNMTLPVLMSH